MRAIILFAFLGSAFAVLQNPGRIVGGEVTTIEAYPFMANMQFLLWGFFWSQSCGGNLITTTSVLSAAHCFYGDEISDWRVTLGSTYSQSGGTVHTISRIIMHREYIHGTFIADLAVVRLQVPAVLSNSINTVSIAGPYYHVADGTTVTHVGWGRLWAGGPSSDPLMHVDVNVINQQLCAERYAYLKTQPGFAEWPDVTDDMICAGILDQGGKDACAGDSGGPLLHGNVVIGLTSWGYECADAVYPGVSARVSPYTNWIVSSTK